MKPKRLSYTTNLLSIYYKVSTTFDITAIIDELMANVADLT